MRKYRKGHKKEKALLALRNNEYQAINKKQVDTFEIIDPEPKTSLLLLHHLPEGNKNTIRRVKNFG